VAARVLRLCSNAPKQFELLVLKARRSDPAGFFICTNLKICCTFAVRQLLETALRRMI
jgi:hypothetical protein